MNILKKYRIHGFLKLTTPLHIASPLKMRFDHVTGRKTYGDKGIACTPIQKMSLPNLRKNDENEWQADVPFVAGNNLNGHLRRAAAAIIFESLLEKGQKVTMETYSAMTCGAVTGNPDSELIKFEEYRQCRDNIFVGLFGGGPRLIRRNVRTHNCFPVNDETLDAGLHSGLIRHPNLDGVEDYKEHIRIPRRIQLVETLTFVRNDELSRLSDIYMQSKVIDNYEIKMQTRQAVILDERKSKDAGEESSRTSTRSFSAMEYLIGGISLPLNFELEVTEAQLGLFLLALDKFAAEDRLGGCTRNGFGQFLLQKVVLVDAKTEKPVPDELFDSGRLIRSENGTAHQYLSAFYKSVQDLTAESLNYLYRPPVVKEKGKPGRKAAATKPEPDQEA